MTVIAGPTPLIALPAVALDTETTGLDPRTARIVQLGAVRIGDGAITGETHESLVDPAQPVPPSATAIHGITDAMLAGAPPIAAALPVLDAFIGDAVVIGHTLGFDLAILARERERAGLPPVSWRWLDTRLLARAAFPGLGHDDLDALCARLGIHNPARHTAPGDALATARLFLALIPALRDAGLRTLAEAEAACQRLYEREARPEGGLPAPPPPRMAEPPLPRLDSFPYRHRVRDVMSAPPVTADPSAPLAEAIATLTRQDVSSLFVAAGGEPPGWGIITERDVLRALHRAGPAALDWPIRTVASVPLQCVRDDDHVYRAIGRMTRLGLRHLGVVDAGNQLVGALTPRNLLRQRASSAIVLGDRVDCAGSEAELAAAWAERPVMAGALLAEGVDARDIAAVISTELRALTRRAAELAEQAMRQAGEGPAPQPHCVLVLGSGGRGESLLAADQDNAIVFADGPPDGPADRWFAAFGARMNAILDAAGLPFCKGGVMARNPPWRLSLQGWRARIAQWTRRQKPEDLLDVDIFFDLMPVHGDAALGEALRQEALQAARAAPDFLKLLAAHATDARPPLTLFGRLRSDETGRIDAKRHGLLPIVTAARVLAIRHGGPAGGTRERLLDLCTRGIGAPSDIAAVLEAHRVLMEASLRQQLADAVAGVPPSSRIAPATLPAALRTALPAAFRAVARAVDLINEGRMG